MFVIPVSLSSANDFVARFHRHHQPVKFHKFSIAAAVEKGVVVGVAIVARPVSTVRDDGATLEVIRLCTDGHKNACSFLYSAAAKATVALGYPRLGTYTLPEESGASLRAVGWTRYDAVGGGTWKRRGRPRHDTHPLGQKVYWLYETYNAAARTAAVKAYHATLQHRDLEKSGQQSLLRLPSV